MKRISRLLLTAAFVPATLCGFTITAMFPQHIFRRNVLDVRYDRKSAL